MISGTTTQSKGARWQEASKPVATTWAGGQGQGGLAFWCSRRLSIDRKWIRGPYELIPRYSQDGRCPDVGERATINHIACMITFRPFLTPSPDTWWFRRTSFFRAEATPTTRSRGVACGAWPGWEGGTMRDWVNRLRLRLHPNLLAGVTYHRSRAARSYRARPSFTTSCDALPVL